MLGLFDAPRSESTRPWWFGARGIVSGDSRMKKVGGHGGAKEKVEGAT